MPGTVTRTIGGAVIQLPKLTLEQCIAVVGRAFESTRNKLLLDLNDSNASPDARQKALAAHRELEGTHDLMLQYVKTMAGARDVIDTSGKAASPPFNSTQIDLDRGEFVILAASLVGFVPAEPDGGDDNDGFVREARPT